MAYFSNGVLKLKAKLNVARFTISLLLRWLAGVAAVLIRYTLIYLSLLFTGKEFSHFLIAHATLRIEYRSARVDIYFYSHEAEENISRHYFPKWYVGETFSVLDGSYKNRERSPIMILLSNSIR
jgi:hypothetical protein